MLHLDALTTAVAVAAAAIACGGCAASKPAAPSFELDCAGANTATAAQVHCVRTDTRNGDIRKVDIMSLPVTGSSTAAASPGAPGRYRSTCAAASTNDRADFYCVRLDTETGEMALVNLTKIGQLPEK